MANGSGPPRWAPSERPPNNHLRSAVRTLVIAVVLGTAMLRQVSEQLPDRREVHRVDLGPSVTAAMEEPILLQCLQMERTGRRRQVALSGDSSGGKSGRPALDQQPEDVETAFLGKGAEHLQSVVSGVGGYCFHISNSMEISTASQLPSVTGAARVPGCSRWGSPRSCHFAHRPARRDGTASSGFAPASPRRPVFPAVRPPR